MKMMQASAKEPDDTQEQESEDAAVEDAEDESVFHDAQGDDDDW